MLTSTLQFGLSRLLQLCRTDAISVRVSREAKAELQRIADAERRTLSQLVAIVIDDYLKKRAGKKG